MASENKNFKVSGIEKGGRNRDLASAISWLEFAVETPINAISKKKRGTLNSLKKYSAHNAIEKAIKVSQGGLGYDEEKRILTIPFYDFFLFLEEEDQQMR